MQKIIDIGFCTLKFYKNYMITTINEGVHVDKEQNEALIKIAENYYSNQPFVYISHRVNSYSVNPNVYPRTSKTKNLAGLAVVTHDFKAKRNAQIEKLFLHKPFEIFATLTEAFNWADELISNS